MLFRMEFWLTYDIRPKLLFLPELQTEYRGS
jgi:hypothetical protein